MAQGLRLRMRAAVLAGVGFLSAGAASAQRPAQPERAPEAASGWDRGEKRPAVADRYMVAAAHPLAAAAGREILREGGSAADAAIAVQLVLGLVEPQSSGLGGGAFLLHFEQASQSLKSYDGRETAPAAAGPDRFRVDGRWLSARDAIRTGLAVGVPGVVRLLEAVHRRHGKLAWARLFLPAIQLAEDGFPVSPRLWRLLQEEGPVTFAPAARAYFFDTGGKPWPVAHRLRNPEYAATLRRIAAEGASAFYDGGPVARAVTAAVAEAPRLAGTMTLSDLAGYEVRERPPVCVRYRGNRVCSMGPPSSGGIAIGQALGLLEGFDLGRGPAAAMAPQAVHLTGEALRLAYADRNWWVADSDFVPVPAGLLDPAYIEERRRLIDPYQSQRRVRPGSPPGVRHALGEDQTDEAAGTSHVSIVDADGNGVALTTTIEAGFGSGLFAAGFLLNNQLTDFSMRPRDGDGRVIANRVEAGKRPRSSMAPVIVLGPDGRLLLVAGSPGGGRIIPYVLKTLIAVLDWQLDAQAAIDLPNFAVSATGIELEVPRLSLAKLFADAPRSYRALQIAIGLAPLGRAVAIGEMTSGSHIIRRRTDGRLEGGADRRREGVALGD